MNQNLNIGNVNKRIKIWSAWYVNNLYDNIWQDLGNRNDQIGMNMMPVISLASDKNMMLFKNKLNNEKFSYNRIG